MVTSKKKAKPKKDKRLEENTSPNEMLVLTKKTDRPDILRRLLEIESMVLEKARQKGLI